MRDPVLSNRVPKKKKDKKGPPNGRACILERNKNHILIILHQIRPVVERQRRPALVEPPAVDIHHHRRLLFIVILLTVTWMPLPRRPDIDRQTILRHVGDVPRYVRQIRPDGLVGEGVDPRTGSAVG